MESALKHEWPSANGEVRTYNIGAEGVREYLDRTYGHLPEPQDESKRPRFLTEELGAIKRAKGAEQRRRVNELESKSTNVHESRFVTAEEASERLTSMGLPVNREEIYRRARDGVFPCVRMGRRIWFDWPKIEAWLESGGQALDGGWRKERPTIE